MGSNEYLIENFPHPKPYLYHLTDVPVCEGDYLKIAIADYGEAGLFLDRVIIRKLIDNIPARFDSEDLPYNIHQLQNGTKTKSSLASEDAVNTLSVHFALNIDMIGKALDVLKTTKNMGSVISGAEH